MMKIYLRLPLLVCLLSLGLFAQTPDLPQKLETAQVVERAIAGGESHHYQIAMVAGQLVRFRLDQRAIDAVLLLAAPDGNHLVEVNLTGIGDQDTLSLEAAADGVYQLTVRGEGRATPTGAYRLEMTVQATATEHDRKRLMAEALLHEVVKLRQQKAKTIETRKQSLEKAQQALTFYRELEDPAWTAYTLHLIGMLYVALNQRDKAIESYEQGLAICREFNLRGREGETLLSLGANYIGLSQGEKALFYLEQALPIARDLKMRAGELQVLTYLGHASSYVDRYEKAIEYYEQTLARAREFNENLYVASALANLAVIFGDLNRYEKQIEYYEQALEAFRALGSRQDEGAVIMGLGNAYQSLGRHEKAIEKLEMALSISREVKNPNFESVTLNNLGWAYNSIGRPEKAIEYAEQALPITRRMKKRENESDSLYHLGVAYGRLDQHRKATEYLGEALAISRELRQPREESKALYQLAVVEGKRGNLAEARSRIEESLRISEAIRSELISPESRATFLVAVQQSYQFYTDLLMHEHRLEPTKGLDMLALEVSERQRARSLLDLLAENRVELYRDVDRSLIDRERALAKQLDEKAQLRTLTSKQAAGLKLEISRLETELERAQAEIRRKSPHYAALTFPQPLKFREVQQLLDAETLLLEYALGEERSYLWAITRDTLVSYELPPGQLIEENARQVHELLTARSAGISGETALQFRRRIAQADAELPAAAAALSRMLLTPVARQLGHKRLVIVADGALQYVPFAMLPDPAPSEGGVNQPLIVGHELVSLPSASALAIQRAELADRKPSPGMLAVIADPVFGRSDERLKSPGPSAGNLLASRGVDHLSETSNFLTGDQSAVSPRRSIIPRLPYTRLEADRILALTPAATSFRAMDFRANRDTVISPELSRYRYVHFATHGVLDSERPGLSSLVLSLVDEKGQPQNGFLRANDIYKLKLPAELVVLSACQTGLGKEIKGEGLVGLTRGFMYAGAARVVVSLWSVNDRATAELMTKFYRRMLKQGERPAAALRSAQVEMWKQKQWPSPFYWAAFTLQGEWR